VKKKLAKNERGFEPCGKKERVGRGVSPVCRGGGPWKKKWGKKTLVTLSQTHHESLGRNGRNAEPFEKGPLGGEGKPRAVDLGKQWRRKKGVGGKKNGKIR